jgi:glycosyltransferase involved in cell wall biosynthesis
VRVGIISNTLYKQGKGTGQSRYLSNILTYLRDIDKENEYILFHRDPSPNRFYEMYEHVEYGRYSSKIPLPFFISWEVAFAKALQRNHVDMIFEPACVGLPLLSWPPRNVVTLMDVMANLFPRKFALKGVTEFRTRLPAVLWKTDAIISPSENSSRDMQRVFRWARGKVKVVPLGLTPDFGRRGESEVEAVMAKFGIRKPYVLMHAVHRWNKNTFGAAEVFNRACELACSKEHQLVLSGGMLPRFEAELRALVSRLGIADRTVITGFVDDASVPALISGATAFLYPAFYEGFGFPVLEAMACGVPIVASSIPTTMEVLSGAGLTAPANDPGTLAKHLAAVMSDESLAAQLGSRALEKSKDFTAERMTRGTVESFREVLGGPVRWRA